MASATTPAAHPAQLQLQQQDSSLPPPAKRPTFQIASHTSTTWSVTIDRLNSNRPQSSYKPSLNRRPSSILPPKTHRTAVAPATSLGLMSKDKNISQSVLKETSGNEPRPVPKRSSKTSSNQPTIRGVVPRAKKQAAPTSAIRSRRSLPNPTSHLNHSHEPDIQPTNPQQIKDLWHKVMSGTRGTAASRAKERATRGGKSRLPQGSETEFSTTSAKTIYARPTDADFRTTVLESRAISIDSKVPSLSAFAHFGTMQPAGERVRHYKSLSLGSDTAVWLDVADKFAHDVVREYRYMTACGLCEAEFSSYAKEHLLKRDPRSLEDDVKRPWRTERMLELVAKPEESLRWCEPPLISSNVHSKPYKYDIRPDCSYWLSLQAFSPAYKSLVCEWIYVMKRRITCPYFSIEFKKDETTLDAAINQVATASALALYNRHQLRQDRLKICSKPWSESDVSLLRHYALTFTGDAYTFWCLTPRMDASQNNRWAGCKMVRVYQNNFSHVMGVEYFIDWVNEIHRWGLTVHGPACQRDVKYCIQKESAGIRTSLGVEELIIDDEDRED